MSRGGGLVPGRGLGRFSSPPRVDRYTRSCILVYMSDAEEIATAIRVIWTNRSEAGYTLDTADLNTIPE